MKVVTGTSKLVKPSYDGESPRTDVTIPLSAFDRVTYNTHIAIIYAFRPPAPRNSDIERGLAEVLSEYREWAGRLREDEDGAPVILLNDAGVRFVEASSDFAVDRAALVKPSRDSLSLHPDTEGVEELMQVQLTRFACGTLVLGFTSHHVLADGNATSNFLIAWGRATRGLPVELLSLHDRSSSFAPRSPLRVEFEHRGVEFTTKKSAAASNDDDVLVTDDDIVFHKAHFTREFLAKLKAKASAGGTRTYSTFQSLVAHLWRVMTKARGLDGRRVTNVRISVDGRSRLRPRVPNQYFGNLVLWAFPQTSARELINRPLQHAASLIHDEVAKLDDGYFRSFIDFASSGAADREGLVANAPAGDVVVNHPNLEVHSWLRFPFYDVDFGCGIPFYFMPSYSAVEGMLILSPSFLGDGSIDVYVSLFSHDVSKFKHVCYHLD